MSSVDTNQAAPPFKNAFIAIGVVWLAMIVIVATGYPNLSDNEHRVGAYVLDAVHNGHWFVQRDAENDVASKPPLLTWIASVVTLSYGRLTSFAVHFPSALATLGAAWLILAAGWKRFGWLAGFLAALMYLLCPMADKELMTSRYDGLFALPVIWATLAAFDAWINGRGWVWFWLACAVANMVKGPLGLLLGGLGLFATIWEWRAGTPLRLRGNHLPGILLFLLICGGWFGLAYLQMGKPLIDKMIGRELVRHSISSDEGSLGGSFWEPSYNVFVYFLPWSFAAIAALWRVIRHPSPDATTRRFERFLFCAFVIALIPFSISPHQRGRLIFPLVPALALLTGREVARWLANVKPRKIFMVATTTAVVVIGFLAVYHHLLLKHAQQIKDTLAMRQIADDVRTQVGEQFPITYVDASFTIEFYLNTYRPWVEREEAAELLRGEAAAFVAVKDPGEFREKLGGAAPEFYTLLAQKVKGGRTNAIISNHPRLEWTPDMAAIIGPFVLHLRSTKLVQARGENFIIESLGQGASSITFSNREEMAQPVRVWYASDPAKKTEHVLKPGETWTP